MVYISNGELEGLRERPPSWEAEPRVSSILARRPGAAFPGTPRGQAELGAKSPGPAAHRPNVPEPRRGPRSPW